MRRVLLIFILLLVTGCSTHEPTFLEDKYYNNNEFIKSTDKDIDKLIDNKETFIVYTYNNFCTLKVHCEDIFKEFMINNNIGIVSIPYNDLKNTKLSKKIDYAPTVIIISKGKVVASLNADLDSDLPKYQDVDEFTKWIEEYIVIKKTTD